MPPEWVTEGHESSVSARLVSSTSWPQVAPHPLSPAPPCRAGSLPAPGFRPWKLAGTRLDTSSPGFNPGLGLLAVRAWSGRSLWGKMTFPSLWQDSEYRVRITPYVSGGEVWYNLGVYTVSLGTFVSCYGLFLDRISGRSCFLSTPVLVKRLFSCGAFYSPLYSAY